jgi:hypothetical protein
MNAQQSVPMKSERDASLALVRRALARARVAQIVLGVVVAALGWLFTLALDAESTLGKKILIFGMIGLFAIMAGGLFWVALFKTSPSRSPLMRALIHRPDDVVWLYQQDTTVQANGIEAPVADTNIMARMADGSTVAVTVRKPDGPALMRALQTLAPRAATGFSEEREARFKIDPRSLSDAGPA